MSVVDTENSENESMEDFIKKYLLEEDYKEEFKEDYTEDVSFFTGNPSNIKKDDWILAKFATKKSLKHYVGQVISVKNEIPTVKFLRKIKNAKGKKLAFTYPNVEDTCEMMHLNDIILVLPQPNISRRSQIFDINLSEYNVQ
ncbi:unnamed protein product [Parnassius apollo]|uniref:(apollo) hypothetical protein n=1 Tax=Parnassius apollo TaxID=110799 RepID=A0A8S3XRU1_PARAO|nr:unnamed protein product [Parnassius apollo]